MKYNIPKGGIYKVSRTIFTPDGREETITRLATTEETDQIEKNQIPLRSRDRPPKAQIDVSNEIAARHFTEIMERLIPEMDALSDSVREDICKRLIDSFNEGVEWACEWTGCEI